MVTCHILCTKEKTLKNAIVQPLAILYQYLTLKAQQNISHLNINILTAFTKTLAFTHPRASG